MNVYIYLNKHLSDPLYHASSFWHLNCDYLDSVFSSLHEAEKTRIQNESTTTAYLTDTVLSIVHSLYGKEGNPYKSQPQVFLPGYEPIEEDIQVISIDPKTVEVISREYQADRIPRFAVTHLLEIIPSLEIMP